MARSDFIALETLPNHSPYHGTKDRSGCEVREPVNGHGDADPDIEGVGDRRIAQPPLLRGQREYRDCHGEGDGRMGGRPAPEDAAAQEAKPEYVAQVSTDVVGEVDPARDGFICGSDKGADDFRLTDSPP